MRTDRLVTMANDIGSFFNGDVPDTHGWLTYVYSEEEQGRREPRVKAAAAERR